MCGASTRASSEVLRDGETETIRGVRLDSGETLEASLYIDCSGFHRLLIEKSLQAGFVDWRHWLMCDRAVALPCAARRCQFDCALHAFPGTGRRLGLAHSAAERASATATCTPRITSATNRPWRRFTGSSREKFSANPTWCASAPGTCAASGSATAWRSACRAGFLEPLESTSISLIQMGIDKLLDLLAERVDCALGRRRIQPPFDHRYERIRDFIILHYSANGRQSGHGKEDLWRYCREMPLPGLTFTQTRHVSRARLLIRIFDSESFFPAELAVHVRQSGH